MNSTSEGDIIIQRIRTLEVLLKGEAITCPYFKEGGPLVQHVTQDITRIDTPLPFCI